MVPGCRATRRHRGLGGAAHRRPWALALLNRGAAAAPILAQFTAFNESAAAAFAVHDIWQEKDVGTFTGSYTATVASEATAYLVLTPA